MARGLRPERDRSDQGLAGRTSGPHGGGRWMAVWPDAPRSASEERKPRARREPPMTAISTLSYLIREFIVWGGVFGAGVIVYIVQEDIDEAWHGHWSSW